jgi:hypothetical protein
MATKKDLLLQIADLRQQIERLEANERALRRGKLVIEDDGKEFLATERVSPLQVGDYNGLCDIVSDQCGNGRAYNKVYSETPDKWGFYDLLSADYKLVYHDYDCRFDPMGRHWLIDYHYNRVDGSSVNDLWILVPLAK